MSKTVNIGSMLVNVVANTSQFVSGLKGAKKELSGFKAHVATVQSGISSALAGLGAVYGGSQLVGEIRQTVDAIDALAETSGRLGIATEKLVGLQYGAQFAGIGVESLESSLKTMNKQLAEAINGSGAAKDVFAAMGLDLNAMAKLAPEQALGVIADKINLLGNSGEKLRAATKIFGGEGDKMLTFLEGGSAAISDFQKKAEQLGITLSSEEANKVAAFADAMDRLSKAWGGAKQEFTITISEDAARFIDGMREFAKGVDLVTRKESRSDPNAVNNRRTPWRERGGWLGPLFRYLSGEQEAKEETFFWGTAAKTLPMQEHERIKDWRETMPAKDQEFIKGFEGRLGDSAARRLDALGQPGGIYADGFRGIYEQMLDGKRRDYTNLIPEHKNDWKIPPIGSMEWRQNNKMLAGGVNSAIEGLVKGLQTGSGYRDQGIEWLTGASKKASGRWLWNDLFSGADGIAEKAKKEKDTYRRDNPALEKGTVEAYRAALANKTGEAQLAESKRQTKHLAAIQTGLRQAFQVNEVGIQ